MAYVKVPASGPVDAEIAIVGEAPGREEELTGQPFVGASGRLLTTLLHSAGINRTECRILNVCPYRPPANDIKKFFYGKKEAGLLGIEPLHGRYPKPEIEEGLQELFAALQTMPKLRCVIALGDTALWALTGHNGIGSWRGSIITESASGGLLPAPVIPTYHPAGILRMVSWKVIAIHDLKRAAGVATGVISPTPPTRDFVLSPSASDVHAFLSEIEDRLLVEDAVPLAVDIETYGNYVDCVGIATSPTRAICIPFFTLLQPEGYYLEEEEVSIIEHLKHVLTHPRAYIIGQNWNYDVQFFIRFFGFYPRPAFDTMLAHHLLYPGTTKSLDYLASLYCDWYCQWKGEREDAATRWEYNAKDCVWTFAIWEKLEPAIEAAGMDKQWHFQMRRLWSAVLEMELRGVRVDTAAKSALTADLLERQEQIAADITTMVGYPLNSKSPKQMSDLFYNQLGLPPIRHRKTGRPTLNAEALEKLAAKEPAIRPLTDAIVRQRSLGVFLSTYAMASLDTDGRIRTSFNLAGTETFRFASSQTAFRNGGNLQNVPIGDEYFPNIRKLFIPDPGYVIADCDLDRADAQVVAWEAEDEELKQMFRENVDIHTENAKVLGVSRKLAKMAVHAINYGVGPRTMAAGLGVTVKQAEFFRARWFAAHPRIKDWHRRVEMQLQTNATIYNAFGYRRIFFDRIEGLLPQALAWVPQSTVACVINRCLVNIREQVPEVELLLQVHDSLVMQLPYAKHRPLLRRVREAMQVTVPYPDPLVIQTSCAVSEKSWGDVVAFDWSK